MSPTPPPRWQVLGPPIWVFSLCDLGVGPPTPASSQPHLHLGLRTPPLRQRSGLRFDEPNRKIWGRRGAKNQIATLGGGQIRTRGRGGGEKIANVWGRDTQIRTWRVGEGDDWR
ncbi:hypothetical protein TIFTF001_014463 [Ficus carica]|uniref:Uncharacterized protein n=1 Tax=Ficus carica TaxID=3494 RepID=A0AA88DIG3_FICCA|nr:hypothetical protein TIFTF001_014463 [Ficus carica]